MRYCTDDDRERARRIVEAARSLDPAGPRRSGGDPIPLRRVLLNMIEESARHDGRTAGA
ncbi:mycothiol transferase [Streptomyces sp. NPDC055060]